MSGPILVDRRAVPAQRSPAARRRPARIRSRLDLPAPLGPTRVSASPVQGETRRRRRPGARRGCRPRRAPRSRPRQTRRLPGRESCTPLRSSLEGPGTPSLSAARARGKNPRVLLRRGTRRQIARGSSTLIALGQDTLRTRRTLSVGGRSYDYFSLPAAAEAGLGDIARLPFSLKVAAGEPAPLRGRPQRQRRGYPRCRRLGGRRARRARDRLPAGPRADAGLHRRAGGGGPRRNARRHDRPSAAMPAASIRSRRSISSLTIR